jgi:uncharacterized protein
MSGAGQGTSLGIMAKYWRPGQVKTRLAVGCNPEIAARIHQQLTLYLVDSLAQFPARRYVFTSPDESCPEMRSAVNSSWEVLPQGSGDLGARMERAFQFMLSSADGSHHVAILIGADLPLLPAELAVAADSLQNDDIVLGPAADGGYYLIGLRGPWKAAHSPLFQGMPWSTDQVLSRTLHVIEKLGLSCRLLAIREDVDTLDSLQRLLATPIDPLLKASLHHALSDTSSQGGPNTTS